MMKMDDLVKTARRSKGSELLPKVSFGTMNAEGLILRMADRIEALGDKNTWLRSNIEADTKVIEAARKMIEAWEQSPTGSHDCCAIAAMEKALSDFNAALDVREKGKNDGKLWK